MKLISWSLVVAMMIVSAISCASVGEVGEEVIDKITTNPMDPDGVLEDPLWPKEKEVEPAETPTEESSLPKLLDLSGLTAFLCTLQDSNLRPLQCQCNALTS